MDGSWIPVTVLVLGTCAPPTSPLLEEDDQTIFGNCDQPYVGIDRFTEVAGERGLTAVQEDTVGVFGLTKWGHGGRSIVEDLDGDGDLDILLGGHLAAPLLYANDGRGWFTAVDASALEPPESTGPSVAFTVVDLDDDGLVDLVSAAPHAIVLHRTSGGLSFAAGEVIRNVEDPTRRKLDFSSVTAGDADQDGDMDLLAITSGFLLDDGGNPLETPGGPDLLLLADGDGWQAHEIEANGQGTESLLGVFTDFDQDGQTDILIPADGEVPTVLYRVRSAGGEVGVEDVARDLSADIVLSAMGLDSADLNGDGRLDYCMTDIGPPRCLVSMFPDPASGFVESTGALGFLDEGPNAGWGIELADLDNDGFLDSVQASGPAEVEEDDALSYRDRLWMGDADGRFVERSEESGVNELANHLGAVAADMDGDGALDILLTGPGSAPSLHLNRCTEGSFLEVELDGPAGNPSGIGAVITVRAGDRTATREVQGNRGPMQGPAMRHFGLGPVGIVDRVEVLWPGGSRSTLQGVDANQRLRIPYPD